MYIDSIDINTSIIHGKLYENSHIFSIWIIPNSPSLDIYFIYIYIYMSVCVCVCVCVLIYSYFKWGSPRSIYRSLSQVRIDAKLKKQKYIRQSRIIKILKVSCYYYWVYNKTERLSIAFLFLPSLKKEGINKA